MPEIANNDTFKTIKSDSKADISIKSSRFYVFIYPVGNVTEIEGKLRLLKNSYHDATHHCYAYIIGYSHERIERSNDAGEPSGTAGRQILTVLQHNNLTDVLCVVVRYFGGTKLGIGGLSRAYTKAARAAVENASIITGTITANLKLDFPYELTGVVESHISGYDAAVIHREFGELSHITCAVRKSRIDHFIEKFNNITRNKGEIVVY